MNIINLLNAPNIDTAKRKYTLDTNSRISRAVVAKV